MIYVLDTGYSGKWMKVYNSQEIPCDEVGHGTAMINLIGQTHRWADVYSIKIDLESRGADLNQHFDWLIRHCKPTDIVLINWVVDRDRWLDSLVEKLAVRCTVICAAGNFSTAVEAYSPCAARGVITVGSLNKSGVPAGHSNFSGHKKLHWMFGTSLAVTGKDGPTTVSGTSAAASVYAALLDRSRRLRRPEEFMRRATERLARRFRRELEGSA